MSVMKFSSFSQGALYSLILAASPSLRLYAGASGGNSTYITVQKLEYFDQTVSTGAIADPSTPFIFNSGSPVAMTFTPPGGSAMALTMEQGSSKFKFNQDFGTQSAMDAAFPNGTYTLAVTGASSFTLSLTGNLYPNTPQITGGTWNQSGQLVIDPTQNETLNFNTFTGYGTAGALSHMMIEIASPDGSTVDLTQSNITPTNPSAFTSYEIPAGTLTAGSIYYCTLEFDTVTSDNTTAVSGDTAVAIYSTQTFFTLVTSGTPSSAPTITQQPTNQTAPIGSDVTFSVNFTGPNNTEVEWFKNGILINQNNNQGGPNLVLNNIQSSDAGSYFVVLSDGSGPYVQSNTVTLTIGTAPTSAPVFTTQPISVSVTGGEVALDAVASNSPNYQWMLNGAPVAGATDSTLLIGDAASAAGSYTCVATNAMGMATSNAATVSIVATSDPGHLSNLSARAEVGTGSNIIFGGFAIGPYGGPGQLPVLIRGSGPALVQFNVPGTLPDPQLQLFSSAGNVLETNDGWAGSTTISSTAAAVGAFNWPSPTSHDAALVETLATGSYTAQIAGESGDTGDALVEIYDASPAGSFTAGATRLTNLSARVDVGTGANVLEAGFVIAGDSALTVLIRASGPAIAAAPFNVPGTLPDPQLTLQNPATGAVYAQNTSWGGDPEISSTAASVGAFTWSVPSSHDSALLITLPPGNYTAAAAGSSGDTGVAIVEVYEVE
jgi:Ig-like domain-containing protein